MIRRVSFLLSLLFLVGAIYSTWCLHRFAPATIVHDKGFPRQWPYPDWLLISYNNYLDRMNPAPPGYIKLHGEVAIVRATVAGATVALMSIGLVLAAPEFRHHSVNLYLQHGNRFEITRLFFSLSRVLPPFRFRLRTLLVLLAICPPLVAWMWVSWRWTVVIELTGHLGVIALPGLMAAWLTISILAVALELIGESGERPNSSRISDNVT